MIIKNTHTHADIHRHLYIYLKMRCSFVDCITVWGVDAWGVGANQNNIGTFKKRFMMWDEPLLDKCSHVTFFDLWWPGPKIMCPCLKKLYILYYSYCLLSAIYAHAIHINNDQLSNKTTWITDFMKLNRESIPRKNKPETIIINNKYKLRV